MYLRTFHHIKYHDFYFFSKFNEKKWIKICIIHFFILPLHRRLNKNAMDKIQYHIGLLKRMVAGTINGKPYVMLDDVEYIIKNSGLFSENYEESEKND